MRVALKLPKIDLMKSVIVLLAVACVATSTAAVFLYRQNRELQAGPQAAGNREIARLLEDVGKLMKLPDEQPTVMTVTEPEKLKDQAFFANAKAGDRVLVFTGAKQAVLYDPVARVIVAVAPVTVGESPQTGGTATGPAGGIK